MRFSYEKCKKSVNRILDPQKSEIPLIGKKQSKLLEINREINKFKLPTLYRYMAFNEYAERAIKYNEIYLVSGAEVNDAFEGTVSSKESNIGDVDGYNEQSQTDIYIKAFSCKKNNLLMWSHYGDAHKGICIGYDFSKLNGSDITRHLYPVQYSNVMFSIDDINRLAIHEFMYLRKSRHWEYEKEWRLIYKKEDLPCNRQTLFLDCISSIQFGLRTDEKDIKKIVELVNTKNEDGNKIKLYRTSRENDSFDLKRKLYIEDDTSEISRESQDISNDTFDMESFEKMLGL